MIASGGVGTLDHLVAGIRDGHATAVLAASIEVVKVTVKPAKRSKCAYPVGCQSDASVIMEEGGPPRLSDDSSRVSAGFPG